MKSTSRVPIAVFLALTWAGVSPGNDGVVESVSEDVTNVACATRLEALEEELASLKAQLAATDSDEEYAECCATSNWYVGVDVAILKPHLGASSYVNPYSASTETIMPDFDYAVAPRIWLAYDGPRGLGGRVTYWQIDTATATVLSNYFGRYSQSSVEAQALDFDVTQRGAIGSIEFQLAGGVRYVRFETDSKMDYYEGRPYEQMLHSFEGVGPTLAVDVRRPVGSWGLAFLGGARAAWLYGESNVDYAYQGNWRGTYELDRSMQTWDAKVGVEWSHALRAVNGQLTLRAVWEAQSWALGGNGNDWYSFPNYPIGVTEPRDIGFSGPTFSIEFRR